MAHQNSLDVSSNDKSEKYPIFRSIFFSLLVLVGLIIITVTVVKMNAKPEEKERTFNTLAVMGARAYTSNVQLSVETQGEVRPQTEIDLVPEVGGKIVYVSPNFVEGGFFKKGETLIRIDDANYQVARIRALAAVAQAEQTLARENAEGEIARRDFEELGRGEPSDLALRIPQRQQAEAALQAAKADLSNADLQLSRTRVAAPFTGRVRSKSSDIGQFVNPGARLGRIFSTDIVEVRIALTDADLSKVDLPIAFNAKSRETAPKVMLSTIIAGKPQQWVGRIMRTDSTYDTQSRALFAIVEVFDPYGEGRSDNDVPLAPGLFVDAKVEGRLMENVVVVSRDGLRPQDEVYVVDDKGQAEIRKTVVLDTNPARAVLASGVESGELVVVSPMERSRIAMPLKVLDVNDPKTIIVDPPEPEWMKKARGAGKDKKSADKKDEKKKKRGFFGRKDKEDDKKSEEDKDAEGQSDEAEANSAEGSGE
jgi:RND family efflux transporter MFP subunit